MEFIILVTDLTNGKEETFKNFYQAYKFVGAEKYNCSKFLNIDKKYKVEKITINN